MVRNTTTLVSLVSLVLSAFATVGCEGDYVVSGGTGGTANVAGAAPTMNVVVASTGGSANAAPTATATSTATTPSATGGTSAVTPALTGGTAPAASVTGGKQAQQPSACQKNPCPACPSVDQPCTSGVYGACVCPSASTGGQATAPMATGGTSTTTAVTGGTSTTTAVTGGTSTIPTVTGGSATIPSGTGGSAPMTVTGGKATASTGGTPAVSTGGSATSSTGGTPQSTGGTPASTGGTSATGGTSSVTNVTTKIEFKVDASYLWMNPLFTYLDPSDGQFYFAGNVCPGTSTQRTCTITSSPARALEFWMATGLNGAGSYSPGKQGDTGFCTAYADVKVTRDGVEIPFAMVSNPAGTGCRFRIEPNAAVRAGADPDGDLVTAASNPPDCAPYNPSIRPPLTADDIDYGGTVSTICANVVNGPETLRFEIPVSPTNAQLLVINPYLPIGCGSATVLNRETGLSVPGTFCEAVLATTLEHEFTVQVNGQWVTYYTTDTTTCLRAFPVYALRNGQLFARYDSQPIGDFRRQITAMYTGSTCHLMLPAW